MMTALTRMQRMDRLLGLGSCLGFMKTRCLEGVQPVRLSTIGILVLMLMFELMLFVIVLGILMLLWQYFGSNIVISKGNSNRATVAYGSGG